ncbi:MAG TPA: hypothetical protein H9692_01405 [Firmicutes bacterium]|nr:hypothetical protein [Bacillota bacterium]
MKKKILYALGIIACLFTIDETDIDININQNNESIDRYKLEDYEISKDTINKISIKINGQSEYSSDKSQFMVARGNDSSLAEAAANRILTKYENGVTYAETEWIGSPRLKLSGHINCQSKYDSEASAYECFGNEFTLDEGLRVKSKLRKV